MPVAWSCANARTGPLAIQVACARSSFAGGRFLDVPPPPPPPPQPEMSDAATRAVQARAATRRRLDMVRLPGTVESTASAGDAEGPGVLPEGAASGETTI